MKTRIITGTLLALVFIPLFVIGGAILDVALLILTAGATIELRRMFNKKDSVRPYIYGLETIFSMGLFFFVSRVLQGTENYTYHMVFLILMVVLITGAILLVFDEDYTSNQFGNSLISIVYPAIGFASLSLLRFDSLEVIGFLFLITIATDIFAYIVGINFGKHRLAVKISPKKSIEGSIGGTFFAVVFTYIYVMSLDINTIGNISVKPFTIIIVIFVISCIGQIGDLIASRLKRDYEIKDYSNIFPGHGGIMDRFDSALFAGMVLVFISEVVGLL